MERAVPSLLSSYANAYNDSERIALLELIIEIMDASRTLYGSMDGLKGNIFFMKYKWLDSLFLMLQV